MGRDGRPPHMAQDDLGHSSSGKESEMFPLFSRQRIVGGLIVVLAVTLCVTPLFSRGQAESAAATDIHYAPPADPPPADSADPLERVPPVPSAPPRATDDGFKYVPANVPSPRVPGTPLPVECTPSRPPRNTSSSPGHSSWSAPSID